MGRDISIFSDYHSGENSLTNHCGILFKLIYRESPQQFEELVVSLLPEEVDIRVGPVFSQQEKRESGVPDLLICQESFRLHFETKIDAWFSDDQLARHVEALRQEGSVNVLFCLSNFEKSDPAADFDKLTREAKKAGVIVQFISFEDLLVKIRELRLSNTLLETIDEFEEYLERNELLPGWKYLLDVVNCGKTMSEIQAGAYMCPNRSGPYAHKRARFLGSYQNKTVPSIHEIDALVSCGPKGKSFKVQWRNNSQNDSVLIERAQQMLNHIAPLHTKVLQNDGLHIFLLGAGATTDFQKDSPGGLLGSKVYFWNLAKTLSAVSVNELANKLQGRKWSEFGH